MMRLMTPVLTAAFAAISTAAIAQHSFTMTSNYPDANFKTQNIRMFLDEVREATEGRVDITLHNNQSLFKIPEVLRAVQTGQVELGELHTGTYGNQDPMFNLDALPFLADDYDAALRLWAAQRPYFDSMLGERNVRVLFAQFWPLQGFYTRGPATSLADLEGLKMRIYSPTTRRMAELLGADPIILPFGEIPQAFGTGLIDSLFTSPQTGIDAQAWDFTKHYVPVGAMRTKTFVIVNENNFQELSDEDRQAVLEAAERAEKRGVTMSDETAQEQLGILAENGIDVSEPSDSFLAELREVGQEMVDAWNDEVGEAHQEVLARYLQN